MLVSHPLYIIDLRSAFLQLINVLTLKTDDKNRDDIDPDKLKYGLQEFPLNEDKEVVYSFLAKYVRKTHSDCEIKRELKNNKVMSFVDMITPSVIAFVSSVIKNNRHVWDQTMRMTGFQTEVDGQKEKKLRPLLTEGVCRKNQQGKSLWSDEGIENYKHAE